MNRKTPETPCSECRRWPYYSADEIEAAVSVLRSGLVNYHTGELGKTFESRFSAHCGTPFGIALANGSVALELALKALKIGPGDEVIVTPRSFIASASCVPLVGATPIFADVDLDSQNLTAESIAAQITRNTKAIVVVHLAGWPCEMNDIVELASSHGLYVIEDCAQAHGATYLGRPVGGLGDMGAFSFCQDKIISTGGEGGMLVLNNETDFLAAWAYKDHGRSFKEYPANAAGSTTQQLAHEKFGTNWRMTEIQAAIGLKQLEKLPDWRTRRQTNASILASAFDPIGVLRSPVPPHHLGHAYYKFYTFLRPDRLKRAWTRTRIIARLAELGVRCFTGTYGQLYNEAAFQELDLVQNGPLPNARELAETSLMFEVHPTLTAEDMERTADVTCSVLQDAQR